MLRRMTLVQSDADNDHDTTTMVVSGGGGTSN